MTRRLLVDDHLLLQVLLGQPVRGLGRRGDEVWTTGLWYHRLCRAVCAAQVRGSLSRMLAVPMELAARTAATMVDLPPEVGLVSLRDLSWPMAQLLADGQRLNLLTLEALAAAQYLDAEIVVAQADDNPPLRSASGQLDLGFRALAV